MKKLYTTNEERFSAVDELARQIDVIGGICREELHIDDYRAIVDNLSKLRQAIVAEIEYN